MVVLEQWDKDSQAEVVFVSIKKLTTLTWAVVVVVQVVAAPMLQIHELIVEAVLTAVTTMVVQVLPVIY
jgi:hypothetical protein